ncbi:pirin family protein [uncultured Maricaulis sp.]|uniref:pirin family protein n=1 Tax=uncultured Maricaulis sp. TaxID=174710 RepID=UPI0030D81481|tara:strand:- start:24826 stop:25527 length:702 start_codon:yes stop_codon:yes gene_type:complete
MIEKRAFDGLGRFRTDWLNARHHFSFGGYHDPDRMGWGALRVWNDDEISADGGFAPHPHENMEIITYVREGAISHRDSLGNAGRTMAGDVQVMSAGSGIRHSEFNQEAESTSLFQIWILPREAGGEPRWDSAAFPTGDRTGQLVVLASGDPETDGGLMIRQDAKVLGATLLESQSVTHAIKPGHRAYLVLAIGSGTVNGVELDARDGAAIRDEAEITISATTALELVMVEVPE